MYTYIHAYTHHPHTPPTHIHTCMRACIHTYIHTFLLIILTYLPVQLVRGSGATCVREWEKIAAARPRSMTSHMVLGPSTVRLATVRRSRSPTAVSVHYPLRSNFTAVKVTYRSKFTVSIKVKLHGGQGHLPQ